MFEEYRLEQLLFSLKGTEARAVMNRVVQVVETFTVGCDQADDISLIVVQRKSDRDT